MDNSIDAIDASLQEHWENETDDNIYALILPTWERSILPSLKGNTNTIDSSIDDFRDRWIRSMRLTIDLFQALHDNWYGTNPAEKPSNFWSHQTYDFLRANDTTRGIDINKSALLEAASTYLSHPEIRNNKFDWLLLDSIIFAELDAFTYHVVNSRAGTGINWASIFAGKNHAKYFGLQLLFWPIGLAIRYVAPAALAYYLFTNGHETIASIQVGLWGLYLLFVAIGYPTRWRARRKATQLLTCMLELYGILGDTVISPRKLKESLEKASATGVVLDGAVFSIVDRILTKDATAFIPAKNG